MAVRGRSRRVGLICQRGWLRRVRWVCWRRRRRGGCWRSGWARCGRGVRCGPEPAAMTEASVSGQLALAVEERTLVAAAVWETLPPEVQREVTVRLARLLARLVEDERGEGARQDHRGAAPASRSRLCAPIDAGAGRAQRRVDGAPVCAARTGRRARVAGGVGC